MTLINQFFSTDHRRLDCLFAAAYADNSLTFEQRCEYFQRFKQELLTHITWEEHLLFPAIESCLPMASGPSNVMRYEHELIKNLLDMIEQIHTQKHTIALAEMAELAQLLSLHNQKEENILYPLIDEHLDQQQVASIFLTLNANTN